MNQRAEAHAAPAALPPAPGRAGGRTTGLDARTGVHARRGRRPSPRRGRGAGPQRPHACSAPPPSPRAAAPPPHTPIAAARPRRPRARGPHSSTDPGGPEAAARRAEGAASRVSAARESRARRRSGLRGAGVGLGDGAGRAGGGESRPCPCWREGAGGSRCRPAAAGARALPSPEGPTGPRVQRAAAGRLGVRSPGGPQVRPSVRASFLPLP